ncbi:MAG: hypothetical protein HY231_00275 [Acidobacteria bacterium]|nr:hypothetical protein [Acidobacteriota bacterium]
MIGVVFIVTGCWLAGFAQQPSVQTTATPAQVNEQTVSSSTKNQTLPKPNFLDPEQLRLRLAAFWSQQNQTKHQAQGIEVVPDSMLAVKKGIVYVLFPGAMLIPMTGGGASGCVPGNSRNVGQIIVINPPVNFPQLPVKDLAKKN